jgi:hypothetical protein
MAKRLRAKPSNTVLLIAGSFIILALVAIAGMNRPLPTYLIAATNLAPGSQVSVDSVRVESLDLGSIAQNYATAADIENRYLILPIASGELIPLRALGKELGFGQTSLRITPGLKPASQITQGARVQIWQVVETEVGFESQLLVPASQVTDLVYGDGLFAAEIPEVELIVTKDQAQLVLQAITAKSAIYLLPLS